MRLPDVPLRELRVLHIGGYWRGPYDVVRQMLLGLDNAVGAVTELNTDEHRDVLDTEGGLYRRGGDRPVWLRWDALRPVIGESDPHLIVCNAGGLSFRPAVARDLMRDRCLLGIALSDPDVFATSTGLTAPNFDFFATNAPECVPRYEAMGVPSAPLPLATDPELFRPAGEHEPLRCDVLVVGTAYPDRVEAVQRVASEFDVHVYGSGWANHGIESRGTILGDDLVAALGSARTMLAFSRTGGGAFVAKHWLFDCLAAGALVITEENDEVARHLRFGEEIVGYRSPDDLVARVRHFLEHPEAAAEIRANARRRVLADFTWERAWPALLETVRAHSGGPPPGAIDPMDVDVDRAVEALHRFIRREGHANVRLDHEEDGFDLGRWVAAVRRRRELDELSRDQAHVLDSIPGWVWDAGQAGWDEGVARLGAFVMREGHASVPAEHVEGGFALGRWVREQRRRAGSGSLERSNRTRLEDVTGWRWGVAARSSRG